MTSFLRTGSAALALLASALIAAPAQAQHNDRYAVAVQAPTIDRFVLRTTGPLEPGREVRFVLVGAPGGQAFLDIPGVLRHAAMLETRPGVYEAGYVVRLRDHPRAFGQAVATLHRGGRREVAEVDVRGDRGHRERRRDHRAPQITELTPSHGDWIGEHGRTRISARVHDEGSGVDPRSVVLRVDGRDVTARTRIHGDEIRYRDDLAPGRHVAELLVGDHAGNVSRRSWSFQVVDRARGPSHGFHPGSSYHGHYSSR